MSRLLVYFHEDLNDPFHFKYSEDLGYWVCHLRDTTATIPLVNLKPEEKFYITPNTGWGISPEQWMKMCDAALTLKMLVDPFRRGEHLEDAINTTTRPANNS